MPRDGIEMRPDRRARWLAVLPMVAILLGWNAYQFARLGAPMRMGHEAWIGRQIGRTARNHLVLGLGITRGANVTAIRQDRSLELHLSYTPLASWAVALPMAAGLPFHAAIRLPVLLSINLFLASLWHFARGLRGPRVAALALAFAAFSPILLFRYGMTCIFEILALGPLMAFVALAARPTRDTATWAGLAIMAVAAVMLSWICWLVILPCVVREARSGRRMGALGLGAIAIAIPIGVHFGTIALAAGGGLDGFATFLRHVAYRASGAGEGARAGGVVTYPAILRLLLVRWVRNLGIIPLAGVAIVLVRAVLRRGDGAGVGWILLLLAFALPMNLARNLAFLHDFFIILFLPAAALCAGIVLARLGGRWRDFPLFLAVGTALVIDAGPARKVAGPRPGDARLGRIADAIGAVVQPDDLVIADGELCGIGPEELRDLGPDRERTPRPYYAGEMAQTVLVARDAVDAQRLAASAAPGRRVVILQVGRADWALPDRFAVVETCAPGLRAGVGTYGQGPGIATRTPAGSRRE